MLGPLPGKQKTDRPALLLLNHGEYFAGSIRGKRGYGLFPVARNHHFPERKHRPSHLQSKSNVSKVLLWMLLEVRCQAARHLFQRWTRLCGKEKKLKTPRFTGGFRIRSLFQNHMSVRAADTKGIGTGAPGFLPLLPLQ